MRAPTTPLAAEAPTAPVDRQLLLSAYIAIAMVLTLGVLSALIGVNGAVIAQGQVAVRSGVKKIQHPAGGVVADIKVANGVHVGAGDVLLVLDATASHANLAALDETVDQLTAKVARLQAERDGRSALSARSVGAAGVGAAAADERKLFLVKQRAEVGEKRQLELRQSQLAEQIRGYEQAIRAKKRQTALISEELVGVRDLYSQNLVPLARLNALERDAAQLDGDVAQLESAIAEARGKISEVQMQILHVDQEAQADAGRELTDAQTQLTQAKQKQIVARQELGRVEIRAPQAGVVDDLLVHTKGGVIAPGETLMQIVPDKAPLYVEARVRPVDIAHVRLGQRASLKFLAFDQRTTPEADGVVGTISAEPKADDARKESAYIVAINLPDAQRRGDPLRLIPGMPVQVLIETDKRSLLSFITKPLGDQIAVAFRQ